MGPDENRPEPTEPQQQPPRTSELPPSPLTAASEGAAQLHELFTSYVEAGFTRPEALDICIAQLTEWMRWSHEKDSGS